MDCLEAQSMISAALDKEPVDAYVLEQAKAHCRTCPDCVSFVRGVSASRRSAPPEPPADLPDRIMTRIRAEAAAKAERQAAATPDALTAGPVLVADTPPPAATTPEPKAPTHRLQALFSDPRRRPQLLLWGGAAAAVFVAASFAAIVGVRFILIPQQAETLRYEIDGAQAPAGADAKVAQPENATVPDAAGTAMVAPQAPGYIDFNGYAYRQGGAAGISEDSLEVLGRTTTALDSGSSPKSREVLGSTDPSRIYIANDDGQLLAFDRVVRSYGDAIYVQTTGAITEFGAWPSLPSSIRTPTSDSGSPTFREHGQDASGVTIYTLAGGKPDKGIAVGPNTAPSDPAAGNPGWTWWAPVR